jgi:hypothetical protein
VSGFRLNYAGLGGVLRSAEMVAEMARRAELVKAQAEATAPYRASDPDPHYQDEFSVEVTDHGGVHGDRAEASVVNSSEHAYLVEFLNGDRTLGRALDAAAG